MKKDEKLEKVIEKMDDRLFDMGIKLTKKEEDTLSSLLNSYDEFFNLLTFLKGHIHVDGYTLKVNCKDLNYNQATRLEELLSD